MGIKKFLTESRNIERDSYLWNMAGGMLMAFQSVIMLMILTRTVGLVEAGIFTIAYANANLFLTIGKYGMRYFQVSDVNAQFSFTEYLSSRWITSAAMIAVSFAYVLYISGQNEYTVEKSLVIIWMCIFKVVDVVEDVFHGMYQQRGRLDIASKAMTLRITLTIIVFAIGVIILRNQLAALMIATVFTTILLVIFIKWTYSPYKAEKKPLDKGRLILLLKSCFPLFAGAFLSFYIGNAPKYAIDAILSDELQACYGFIAMPVFVIGLLNNFIFNPMLFKMSCLWAERQMRPFLKRIFIQIGIIGMITGVCILGAYILGVPVLSFMYNTDLSPYKSELLILLVGGGFLGLSGLLNAVITIIRFQKTIVWGYGLVAVLAFVLSERIVRSYEMMGAAILYTILMGLLCVCFLILFTAGILIEVRKSRQAEGAQKGIY